MISESNTLARRPLLVIVFVALSASLAPAVELVRAEIEKESAWTGEAVPLIVKLYSPGPFSGTASFDLPDLPRTTFVQAGNPLVGSEEVDGESYFTQRHQLTLYTQRDGEIVVPAFRVRFAGKKTFTADPEPMEGLTQELRFQSKRPPGTESMGLVVSATEMDIQQAWHPKPTVEIKTGDIVVRTTKQTAVGTTSMMLQAVPTSAPEGIQVYTGTPEVRDIVDRGDARAERIDTTKYQFQRAGSFMLPDIVFVWWDPKHEKLQRQKLPGLTIAVVETSAADSPASEPKQETSFDWLSVMIGLLVMSLFAWLSYKPVLGLFRNWQAYRNRPQSLAVRKLRTACDSNDASAAYSALLSWAVIQRDSAGCDRLGSCFEKMEYRELAEKWEALSRHLYASDSATTGWQGRQLWIAFSDSQSRPKRDSGRNFRSALPELNPDHPTTRV